jgi:hypothetical protein
MLIRSISYARDIWMYLLTYIFIDIRSFDQSYQPA